jgi:DNA-binding NarL/FixJ family response regulator
MMQDIVIVDDDTFTRAGLTAYLQSIGYAPRSAGDVQTAWEMVVNNPPPTAVIDIRLPLTPSGIGGLTPEPHGLALVQRIKGSFPTMGIVLLSAHPEYEREIIQMTQRFMRSIAFLHKGGDMNRLDLALQEVQAGRTVFQSELVNRYVLETAVRSHFDSAETYWIDQALSGFDSLSPREAEIAHLLAAAYTRKPFPKSGI